MSQIYLSAALGGVLIGLASALPLWWHGRVAGASGYLSDLVSKKSVEKKASLFYVMGLVGGGLFLWLINEDIVQSQSPAVNARLIVGALLVGFGARLGGGCTSGHGVCGMARFSRRSIVATIIFLSVAILVANLVGALA